MNLTEIVNKAIPLSFEGVKCAATEKKLRAKAEIRREQLTSDICTLLKTASHAGIDGTLRMDCNY